jgi:hypothetical protein
MAIWSLKYIKKYGQNRHKKGRIILPFFVSRDAQIGRLYRKQKERR